MKNFTLLLLIFAPLFLNAQKTKKVTEKHKDYPEYKEEYNVLKSDRKIRHGRYTRTEKYNGSTTGFYKNGMKDSTWTMYDRSGEKEVSGNYLNDQKSGPWTYYNSNEEKEQVYDYTTKKLLYSKNVFSDTVRVINGMDTVDTKVDTVPIYIGGKLEMARFMMENFRYPETAIETGIEGKVWIAFTINIDGSTSGYRILKHVCEECDAEAIRVMKALPNGWVPAKLNGKPVATEFFMPINFKLD